MAVRPDEDPVHALHEHLRAHPADRDPLQHALGQFHLGGLLLERGAFDQAEEAYASAAALFAARGARPEQAKALNGLGATLRAAGRHELAARALAHAAAGLAAAGLALEEGAARFNLGLVLRETGRAEAAVAELARAVDLLDPARVPAQAAAAARELGSAQLALGDLAAAQAALVEARELADRIGDHAGGGAAANALGLTQLAAERPAEAADSFRTAAAANPRALRPEAFAMAKANLAIALERSGAPAGARLAARQAVAVAGAAAAVRAQAAGVLERLGTDVSDLRVALEEAPDDVARARLVREELARAADTPPGELEEDAEAWIHAHVASALDPEDVGELWLGGLLELPPQALERLVGAALAALAGADAPTRETFRHAVTRAMPRFHVPQWMRLQDVFSQAAGESGDPGPWR